MPSGDEIPKERVECICIACISVDSVLKVDKSLSTSLLEQFKYKIKKREPKTFIDDYEIDRDSSGYESD